MRYKKESIKQVLSYLLVILMIFSSISVMPVKAAKSKTSQQEKIFIGNGYEITFKVTKQYSGTFNADVIIKNTNDVPIDNWTVAFSMPYKITSISNGVVKSDNNGNYIIKNTGSNQDIEPGKSVSFDFSAACDGNIQIPQTYRILSFEEAVPSQKYNISYKAISDKKSGLDGEIRIKNLSEETIEAWKLQFDFGVNINRFEKVSILEHKGNHYYVKSAGQNSNIKPGETLVLGLSGNLGSLKTEPANYVLSQTVQDPNVIDSDKDSDKDGLADSLETTYRTDPFKADTDGDGLNDYIEVRLGLNPLSKDTDKNGINDGLEDTDNDKLSNLDEIKAGADYSKKDTDGDGLLDGEEIKIYHTSPILKDTDGDSVTDGDEILLKLNPLKVCSDGVTKDSERKIQQRLSDKKIADSLKDNSNLFVPALSGAVPKVMDKEVSIEQCDNDALLKNHAIIGKPIQVKTSLKAGNSLKLSFNFKNFLTKNDESALNMLTIYHYTKDGFTPLDTKKDEANKCLYTNIAGEGIYFILNVKEFLNNLGINPLNQTSSYIKPHSIKGIETDKSDIITATPKAINTTDGTYVLLNDYQYIKLSGEVSATNGIDTDGDGISDYKELGTKVEEDLTPSVQLMLQQTGVPEDYYSGKTTITVYNYTSNPILPDTDYDGKNDNIDSSPRNNSLSGVLHTAYADSNVSYIMDYRNFFNSNSSYSHNIGTISSLYSSVVYGGDTFGGMGIEAFMQDNGLYDVHDYNLASMYNDSDVSEAYIGHRKVTYNGQSKEIIAVIVRGTNGTIKEWSSNFDIGTTSDYYKYGDWMVASNHKGFDVAATRILRCLQQYESLGYIDKSMPSAYWVMGHSRGAAIANIIGARLIDQSKYVYDYTFASPNTTTAYNAGSYTGIYNILNTDDFVPYLPMAVWGFTHYGKSVSISIADNYETEWEDLTKIKNEFGIIDYNMDAIGMDNTINQVGAIMNNRNQGYIYTCADHGDGSSDNITITNYGTSKSSREGAIAKIPSNALPYCKITRHDGFLFVGWDFDVCQTPEYFMQVLAAYMGGTISAYRFEVELNIADRYEAAKSAIVRSGLGGLANPHYTESYYLLSTHVYTSSFS